MQCTEARQRIDEKVNGTLPAESEVTLFAHLERCGECSQDLEQLRRVRDLLLESLNDTPASGRLLEIWQSTEERLAEPIEVARPLASEQGGPNFAIQWNHLAWAYPYVVRYGLVASVLVGVSMLLSFSFMIGGGAAGKHEYALMDLAPEMSPTAGYRSPKFETKSEMKSAYASKFEEKKSDERFFQDSRRGEFKAEPPVTDPAAPAAPPLEPKSPDASYNASDLPLPTVAPVIPPNSPSTTPTSGAGPGSGVTFGVVPGDGKEGAGRRAKEESDALKADPKPEPRPDSKPDPAADPMPNPNPQRKPLIIKTGDITTEVKSFSEASKEAHSLAAKHDAIIADNRIFNQPGGTRSGLIVIRVVPEKFEQLFAELKKLGTVLEERANGQDITNQFFDTEANIKNLKITEERLQELLKSKSIIDRISSLLEVEREVTRVRGQIEALQGQMRLWQNQLSFSTIRLTIQEPARPVPGGSLSIEVLSHNDAKAKLDDILAKANGQLSSGRVANQQHGALQGNYQIRLRLSRFAEFLNLIKPLGRVTGEQIANLTYGAQNADGADVYCELQLQLHERHVQLPGGTVQIEVKSLSEAIPTLNQILAKTNGSISNNQTQRQPNAKDIGHLTLEVKAMAFTELMNQLPTLGRITNRQVAGDGTQIRGGAADQTSRIQLILSERMVQVPTGRMNIEVEKFELATAELAKIVADKNRPIQELQNNRTQRHDGSWQAEIRLAMRAGDMDAVVPLLERLGDVKSRQMQGLGLGEAGQFDPTLLGEVNLSLFERPALQVPSGQMTIEIDKFEHAITELGGIIDKRAQSIWRLQDSRTQRSDGTWQGDVRLAIRANEMEEVIPLLERLGQVKSRQILGLGVGASSRFDAKVKGEISLSLQEKPAFSAQESNAFRILVRETLDGLLTSLARIIFGLGILLPWALVVWLVYIVVRWSIRSRVPATAQADQTVTQPTPPAAAMDAPKPS